MSERRRSGGTGERQVPERTGFVALGSNLGDRRENLEAGLRGMASRGVRIEALSSVWETEPVDSRDPWWFLNMVAKVRTDLSAREMLEVLLEVERLCGRRRGERNAARILDLDLLVLGDLTVSDPDLTLPHPRMWHRRFVLAPLAELAPDLRDSSTGRTVQEACAALDDDFKVRNVGVLAGCAARHL